MAHDSDSNLLGAKEENPLAPVTIHCLARLRGTCLGDAFERAELASARAAEEGPAPRHTRLADWRTGVEMVGGLRTKLAG